VKPPLLLLRVELIVYKQMTIAPAANSIGLQNRICNDNRRKQKQAVFYCRNLVIDCDFLPYTAVTGHVYDIAWGSTGWCVIKRKECIIVTGLTSPMKHRLPPGEGNGCFRRIVDVNRSLPVMRVNDSVEHKYGKETIPGDHFLKSKEAIMPYRACNQPGKNLING